MGGPRARLRAMHAASAVAIISAVFRRSQWAVVAALLFTVGAAVPAWAQTPDVVPVEQKRVTAVRAPNGRIVVDGRMQEPEWPTAAPATEFVQQQPKEGAPVTQGHRSEVRFLYDDDYFYIGATFYEDHPDNLVVNELKR